MFHVWIAEQLPACLLLTAHTGRFLDGTITKDIPEASSFLKTTLDICQTPKSHQLQSGQRLHRIFLSRTPNAIPKFFCGPAHFFQPAGANRASSRCLQSEHLLLCGHSHQPDGQEPDCTCSTWYRIFLDSKNFSAQHFTLARAVFEPFSCGRRRKHARRVGGGRFFDDWKRDAIVNCCCVSKIFSRFKLAFKKAVKLGIETKVAPMLREGIVIPAFDGITIDTSKYDEVARFRFRASDP